MTGAGIARSRSVLATWLLFADGWRRAALVALLISGACVFMAVGMPGGKDPVRFGVFTAVFMLPWATWTIERQAAHRLAFLSLVPQPVPPQWLVLAPMCAIAVIAAAATAAFGRRPPVAGLAVLGCALWMVGSARWLHRFGLWTVVAWIFVPLAPIASYGAYRIGGWGAAAAVAMAFGAGALLFQPRAYVGRPLPRADEQQPEDDAPAAARAPTARQAISAGARTSELASAWRVFVTVSGCSPLLLILSIVMSLLIGARPTADNPMSMFVPFALIFPWLLGRAYSSETQEFLVATPLAGRARVVGGVVFPLLLMMLGPMIAACAVNRELFDHNGAMGWILRRREPVADTIRYVRHVLGATFIPEKWPASGLPIELWVRLRPLLYLDFLRMALLTVTLTFAFAPYIGSGRKDRRPLSIALGVVALASFWRLGVNWTLIVPVPPVWFAALLAAASIGEFWRRARAVVTPARERGAP